MQEMVLAMQSECEMALESTAEYAFYTNEYMKLHSSIYLQDENDKKTMGLYGANPDPNAAVQIINKDDPGHG